MQQYCRSLVAAITVGLLLSTAPGVALGYQWPWSESEPDQVEYCRGLVSAGLASPLAVGDQRTALWLGWNYLVRNTAMGKIGNTEAFQSGIALIEEAQTVDDIEAIISDADGRCGLDRHGYQVTGL